MDVIKNRGTKGLPFLVSQWGCAWG